MAAAWRMKVRAGSKVERDRFASLDEALTAVRARLVGLRRDAPRGTVRAFAREYEPVQQVAARLEVARGRLGRPRGGIDVRGDGSAEAWVGLVRKELLEPGGDGDVVSALERALTSSR